MVQSQGQDNIGSPQPRPFTLFGDQNYLLAGLISMGGELFWRVNYFGRRYFFGWVYCWGGIFSKRAFTLESFMTCGLRFGCFCQIAFYGRLLTGYPFYINQKICKDASALCEYVSCFKFSYQVEILSPHILIFDMQFQIKNKKKLQIMRHWQ